MTTRLLSFATVFVAALFGFGATAQAQSADCGPLQGTIQIADDDLVRPGLATVTPAQARAAALRAVPNATVTDVDLEEEGGFLVYEVDLVQNRTEFDVYVDAGSGEVLCVKRD